jgi:hypothetical protein
MQITLHKSETYEHVVSLFLDLSNDTLSTMLGNSVHTLRISRSCCHVTRAHLARTVPPKGTSASRHLPSPSRNETPKMVKNGRVMLVLSYAKQKKCKLRPSAMDAVKWTERNLCCHETTVPTVNAMPVNAVHGYLHTRARAHTHTHTYIYTYTRTQIQLV